MSSKVTKRSNKTRSARAGLKFPVGRIHRFLRNGNFAKRVGNGAAIYLAAALEYLATEIFELAIECATQHKKHRISPRHLLLAIKNDEELDMMLKGVTISQAGVLPTIHPQLLPKKTAKSNTSGD